MARVIHALADADFAVKGGEKDSAYKSHSSLSWQELAIPGDGVRVFSVMHI
jgi:hypothetical protein